jgi:thiol:disulfide interchange protein
LSAAASAAAGAGAAAETEAAAPAAAPPGKTLREVTHEDYYAAIEAAGDKLVVVDCYTEWCVVLAALGWGSRLL